MNLRIGTRPSQLALKQTEEILVKLKSLYTELSIDIIKIHTTGDKDKNTPISEIEGSDFFTREIDEAILNGDIDFAVHSAKDLPDVIPEGLTIAAITKSIDPYDALVSKENKTIENLRIGAKVGASSLRRKVQLKKYREDFRIVDIRGDIEERLERLERDNLDAIIVAACALIRLGLQHRIIQRIDFKILKPHPLQGSLAIVAREDDKELINLLKALDVNS